MMIDVDTLTAPRPAPRTRRRTSAILDASGRPMQIQSAYFDNAATHRMNEKHWANAVGGDFNTLLSGDLNVLRRRARYEIANNAYGAGIADTLAFDIVGTGPYPQADSGDEAFDQELEEKFMAWGQRCDFTGQMDLAEILQMQMALQQCEAGESLTVLKRDNTLRRGVRLRLVCIDIDRLSAFLQSFRNDRIADGIEYDADGRPKLYYILDDHPAGTLHPGPLSTTPVAADDMIHLYRIKRPGQRRGVPWFTPSLGTFAQLRRFAQATLDAAESAANNHGTIEAEGYEAEPPEGDTLDVVELERNAFLTLPPGFRLNQVKPEHPATTFQMFKNEIINEIGRGVLMPFNVAAMNSSRYNYASGRLDHQKYHRFIECIRHWGARRLLNRIFAAWMQEAWLTPGFFRTRPSFEQAMRAVETLEWYWPGFKHVDPIKEANAQKVKLSNGTTTLEDCYAEEGHDWKRKLEQRAKEAAYKKELLKKYNLTPGEMDPDETAIEIEDEDDANTPQTQDPDTDD